jgi:hypothetical protein
MEAEKLKRLYLSAKTQCRRVYRLRAYGRDAANEVDTLPAALYSPRTTKYIVLASWRLGVETEKIWQR